MHQILHNKFILYFVFLFALADFLYLGSIEDIKSISVFVCIVILTVFFSKNMIVVLSSALIVTNVLKYGIINEMKEGFTDDSDDSDDNIDEETDEKPIQKKKTEKIKQKAPIDSVETTIDTITTDEKYTSVKDQQLNDQEKMMLAHEKLLERMNKYKPLLDTLQGITKNIAVVKSMTVSKETIE